MDMLPVGRVCSVYGLGDPLQEPQAIIGGLLHRLWRLDTTLGAFAVKQLNPAIMRKPYIRDTYRLTERIATTMAEQGIPAVPARACGDDWLHDIDGITVMVYPWVDGVVLPSVAVEPACARHIGTLLGRMHTRMHALDLQALLQPEWQHFPDDDWELLTFQAYDSGLSWAHPVHVAIPRLSEWSHLYEQAGERLSSKYVISHRELNQKNVLWRDTSTPRLIDWEAAGLINPTMELVSVALDWSGLSEGTLREDTFAALIERYLAEGGSIQATGRDALHGVMGIWLGWLLFNMRRSLGETTATEDEQLVGVSETLRTLSLLRFLDQHVDQWAAWVDRWHQMV